MTKAGVIQAAEKFVQGQLAEEGTGHDWGHIQRVRNNAALICKSEKADTFIIDLAALLHDVGDRKVIRQAEDDYSIAGNFLKAQPLSEDLVERVMFIIRNMSFSKSSKTKREAASIEFQIVQDADRLDAMDAIGIARAFAFGGSRGRPLYDPDEKASQEFGSSSLHHFEQKLFLLKDLMNTPAAKRIAASRHEYMKQYVAEFLAEWNGQV